MNQDHRRYEEELAAYMLDALTVEEKRRFEEHLGACAACQAEERWLRGAVEVLPSSVEQVEAPPELRERLMATVRAEAPTAAESKRRPWLRRPRGWTMLRPAAALASLLVVAAGVGGYLLGNDDGPATSTVAVEGTEVRPTAGGRIVRSGNAAVLRVWGLPQPGRDRVYQVWLLHKGATKPEPSSLFSVHRDGSGATGIPSGLEGVEQVMVSEEPASGSSEPTQDPVLAARLS